MKNDYFNVKKISLSLSQCDIDMLIYAMNNVDWAEYDKNEFGGEDIESCAVHLDDIQFQLEENQ